MKIEYNKEKLKRILDDLYQLMGINMAIVDVDFNYIYKSGKVYEFCEKIQSCKNGKEKCYCSDMDMLKKSAEEKRFISHKCHAGLIDSVVPVIKDNFVVGFVVIGRIRSGDKFEEISRNISWLNYKYEEMESSYNNLKYLSDVQIESLSNLISHIIFENAIELVGNDFCHKVTEYIDENLSEKLSVSQLCSVMLMSKNVLYKNFHRYFGCSVNDYILSQRIKKAQGLILNTDEKIHNIALSTGISNYTYFCRIFKKKTGFTPTEYKKKYSRF